MTEGPNWKLEDDLKTVTISFPTNPPVSLKLDAAGIDDLLANVGLMRAAMLPPHEETWQLGQKIGAIANPAWATEPDLMQGNSLIHMRDPRFGWLHYLLPRAEAAKLAHFLQIQAEAPPQSQSPGKAN